MKLVAGDFALGRGSHACPVTCSFPVCIHECDHFYTVTVLKLSWIRIHDGIMGSHNQDVIVQHYLGMVLLMQKEQVHVILSPSNLQEVKSDKFNRKACTTCI